MSKKTLEEKLVEGLEKTVINLRLLTKALKQHERRIARLERQDTRARRSFR